MYLMAFYTQTVIIPLLTLQVYDNKGSTYCDRDPRFDPAHRPFWSSLSVPGSDTMGLAGPLPTDEVLVSAAVPPQGRLHTRTRRAGLSRTGVRNAVA